MQILPFKKNIIDLNDNNNKYEENCINNNNFPIM